MTGLVFDDDVSRAIEATYLSADVVEQRRATLDALDARPGEHAVDVGSGPGLLAAELGERVGASGSVLGVDPSDDMLAISARRAAPNVTFRKGDATDLPVPEASVDLVTATQVYEYVPDLPAALAEVRRVLRPGGRLLILDTDWDSVVWHSSNPERMGRVLTAWDDHLADPHLPRRLGRLLTDAGFAVREVRVLPILNAGYRVDTYSAGLAGFVANFVTGHRGVTADEAAAWRDELVEMGDDYFFSVNRYLFLSEVNAP